MQSHCDDEHDVTANGDMCRREVAPGAAHVRLHDAKQCYDEHRCTHDTRYTCKMSPKRHHPNRPPQPLHSQHKKTHGSVKGHTLHKLHPCQPCQQPRTVRRVCHRGSICSPPTCDSASPATGKCHKRAKMVHRPRTNVQRERSEACDWWGVSVLELCASQD